MTQGNPPSNNRPFTAWVLAGALILGGIGYLVDALGIVTYTGPMIPVLAGGISLLALPFFARWFAGRDQWWALISSWIFISMAITLMVIFIEPPAQVVAIVVLLEVALPFAVTAILDQTRWWAWIPAYALLAVAILMGLTIAQIPNEMLGAFALLLTALPLWGLYMLDRSRTWALIPAGLVSLIAILLLVLFSIVQIANSPMAMMFFQGTLAVVSFILWVTNRRLDWGLWLGIGLGLSALATFWFPDGVGFAIIALSVGSYILFKQVQSGRSSAASSQAQPKSQPQQASPDGLSGTTGAPPVQAQQQQPAPAASPSTGASLDSELTKANEQTHEPAPRTSPAPGVEFTPIDPLRKRKEG